MFVYLMVFQQYIKLKSRTLLMCILKMLYKIFTIGNTSKFATLAKFKQP